MTYKYNMQNETIQNISVDVIDDPFKPVRSEISVESIEDLARDIKKHGLIQPITVRKKGNRFEVVAGHRRFRATKLAGIATIRAVVAELDDEQADAVKVRENLYREDINPVDEAHYIAHLIERYKYEPAQLADIIGKSESYLMGRYAILEYPDYLQEALKNEQIGITSAQWLVKITNERVRRDYTSYAVRGGITVRRAEAWYRSWSAGNLPRDPDSFQAPEKTDIGEPVPLLLPCVLCNFGDDIGKMEMCYAHPECARAAAAAAKGTSDRLIVEKGAPAQTDEATL